MALKKQILPFNRHWALTLGEIHVKNGEDSFWTLWTSLEKFEQKEGEKYRDLHRITLCWSKIYILLLLCHWQRQKEMPNLSQWKGAWVMYSIPHDFLFFRNNRWLFCNCWFIMISQNSNPFWPKTWDAFLLPHPSSVFFFFTLRQFQWVELQILKGDVFHKHH